jgi:hypothetical protein
LCFHRAVFCKLFGGYFLYTHGGKPILFVCINKLTDYGTL